MDTEQTWDARDSLDRIIGNGDYRMLETRLFITEAFDDFGFSVDLVQRIAGQPGAPPVAVCSNVTMKEYVPGAPRPRPLMLSRASAQDLVDQLCALGVRPTSAPDIPIGEKQAMADHITDLRAHRSFVESIYIEMTQHNTVMAMNEERKLDSRDKDE